MLPDLMRMELDEVTKLYLKEMQALLDEWNSETPRQLKERKLLIIAIDDFIKARRKNSK